MHSVTKPLQLPVQDVLSEVLGSPLRGIHLSETPNPLRTSQSCCPYSCCSFIRSPWFGVGREGLPRFVPICSDFPVFFRFVPICAPCFREYPDLFRFVPICSVFFRFVPICFRTNQNKSGKPLSADPFCKSPIILLQYSLSLSFSDALGQPIFEPMLVLGIRRGRSTGNKNSTGNNPP